MPRAYDGLSSRTFTNNAWMKWQEECRLDSYIRCYFGVVEVAVLVIVGI